MKSLMSVLTLFAYAFIVFGILIFAICAAPFIVAIQIIEDNERRKNKTFLLRHPLRADEAQ